MLLLKMVLLVIRNLLLLLEKMEVSSPLTRQVMQRSSCIDVHLVFFGNSILRSGTSQGQSEACFGSVTAATRRSLIRSQSSGSCTHVPARAATIDPNVFIRDGCLGKLVSSPEAAYHDYTMAGPTCLPQLWSAGRHVLSCRSLCQRTRRRHVGGCFVGSPR